MKRFIPILFVILSSCAGAPSWVHELEERNPLKNDANCISVYFRFDTIVNGFEVSGILYPFRFDDGEWSANENGVRLFFHSHETGADYMWTDWDESAKCFKNTFMSKNVSDIVRDDKFKGFQNGDIYTFKYDTCRIEGASNSLMPNAEFQFYDIDYDGEQELLLGYFHGGPYSGTCYEVYEMTEAGLVKKCPINDEKDLFMLDYYTSFNPEERTITNTLTCGVSDWGTYCYTVDEQGELHFLYHVSNHMDIDRDCLISDTTSLLSR